MTVVADNLLCPLTQHNAPTPLIIVATTQRDTMILLLHLFYHIRVYSTSLCAYTSFVKHVEIIHCLLCYSNIMVHI